MHLFYSLQHGARFLSWTAVHPKTRRLASTALGVPRFDQLQLFVVKITLSANLRSPNFVQTTWFQSPVVTSCFFTGSLSNDSVFDRVGENPQRVSLFPRNRPLTTDKLFLFHIRGISACHVKRANSDINRTSTGVGLKILREAETFIFIFCCYFFLDCIENTIIHHPRAL